MRISIMYLFLLYTGITFGQDLPQLIPVSPNAAGLSKYGSYPVDLNSGVPQISIPIYTIEQGTLKVPINISYHASGIKVNEMASMVGLGWSLNAGGIITRQVKGIPDEYTSSPLIDADNAAQDLDTYLDFKDIYYKRKDSSPDIYIFNFNGVTGRFYIENGEIISESSSSMKIERIGRELFVITMPDGTTYRFGTSLDGESAYEFTDKRTGVTYTFMDDMITSWYLTEIISANKKDTIYFKYKDNTYTKDRELVGSTIRLSSLRYGFLGFGCNWRFATPQSSIIGPYSNDPTEVNSYSDDYYISAKIIDTIVFKNGKIKLNTTTGPWFDNSVKLNSLEVINNNQTVHLKASFQHDGANQDRMKLNSLSVSGRNNVDEKKYEFVYNNLSLPNRNSKKQDYWGYANNNTGGYVEEQEVEFLGNHYKLGNGDKSTDEINMKAGILEKIIYPTGGYTEFEFEANKIHPGVKEIITTDGEVLNAYGYGAPGSGSSSSWCADTAHEKELAIVIPENGFVKINAGFTPAQQNGGNPQVQLRNSSGVAIKTYQRPAPDGADHFPGRTVNEEIWLPSGNYSLYVRETAIGGMGAQDCPLAWIRVDWNITTIDINPPLKDVGGLRIKTIKSYDGTSTTPSTIKDYEYSDGILKTHFNKEHFTKYAINYSPIPIGNDNINTSLELLLTASSSPLYEIESNGITHIEYQKVTEYLMDSNSNKNGKTIYYFDTTPSLKLNVLQPFFNPGNITFAQPYMTWFNYLSRNRPPYYLTKPWSGGQLKKKEIYSLSSTGQDKLISTLENEYENVNEKLLKPLLLYNLITPLEQNCSSPTYYYSYLFGNGFISTGKKLLTSSTETQYDLNGENPIVTEKSYTYNHPNYFLTESSVKDSKKGTLKTKNYYPNSRNSLTDLSTTDKNMYGVLEDEYRINTPIQTENYRNNILLSTQRILYKQGGHSAQVKSIQTTKGTISTTNPLEDRVHYHRYNTSGKPVEVSRADGTRIVYIWGYQEELPIAKIENVTYSEVSGYINDLQTKSNADTDHCRTSSCKEQILRNALQTLREALPNAMVSTYTYDPLVGVTSMTDPKGYTMYYEYDGFNRLQFVKDADGNLISENKYQYKNN